jgi:hypothetical protein
MIPDNDKSYKPWKVRKNGKHVSEHRHYVWAEEARGDADEITYVNERGFWANIWRAPAPAAPEPETEAGRMDTLPVEARDAAYR